MNSSVELAAMRIPWLSHNQNEFDIAELPDRPAEPAGDMASTRNPPQAFADRTEARTGTVG